MKCFLYWFAMVVVQKLCEGKLKKFTLIIVATLFCVVLTSAQKQKKYNLTKVASMKVSKEFLNELKTNIKLKSKLKAKKSGVSAIAGSSIYKLDGKNVYFVIPDVKVKKLQDIDFKAMSNIDGVLEDGTVVIITCECNKAVSNDDCTFVQNENKQMVCRGNNCTCVESTRLFGWRGTEIPQ